MQITNRGVTSFPLIWRRERLIAILNAVPTADRVRRQPSLFSRHKAFRVECRGSLGHGTAVFHSACHSLMHWKMFNVGWLRLVAPAPEPQVGHSYGIACCVLGICAVSVANVAQIRVVENDERIRLTIVCRATQFHMLIGSETFTVVLDRSSQESQYRIRSRSWVAPLFRPLTVFVRYTQRRFASASCEAMQRAVSSDTIVDLGNVQCR